MLTDAVLAGGFDLWTIKILEAGKWILQAAERRGVV